VEIHERIFQAGQIFGAHRKALLGFAPAKVTLFDFPDKRLFRIE
jgi:hypothetical protein